MATIAQTAGIQDIIPDLVHLVPRVNFSVTQHNISSRNSNTQVKGVLSYAVNKIPTNCTIAIDTHAFHASFQILDLFQTDIRPPDHIVVCNKTKPMAIYKLENVNKSSVDNLNMAFQSDVGCFKIPQLRVSVPYRYP